jgi:hypothetical protein
MLAEPGGFRRIKAYGDQGATDRCSVLAIERMVAWVERRRAVDCHNAWLPETW